MKIKVSKEITNFPDLFKELQLEEDTVYLVEVQMNASNPKHQSFLFTGFQNGNYCFIYNNTSGDPTPLERVFSLKILKKLYTKK